MMPPLDDLVGADGRVRLVMDGHAGRGRESCHGSPDPDSAGRTQRDADRRRHKEGVQLAAELAKLTDAELWAQLVLLAPELEVLER